MKLKQLAKEDFIFYSLLSADLSINKILIYQFYLLSNNKQQIIMTSSTNKLKQWLVTNPNKAFNSSTNSTSRELASKAKTINNSQDIESFLPLILDQIKINEVNAQKEISKLKNSVLKSKLIELNKQFNYFKYRVKKLQYFKDYLQILFRRALKDGLVKPSLNDYKYETGLLQPKLLEDVIRLTNNSKILYISAIQGRKLKVEEYYQFVPENVIKYIDKINQKQSPLKINPPINEQQFYDQFMKLSKGTFNRLNTKLHYYCKQKTTLDLLSSINTQILQSQQKVISKSANNNLVYQGRDQIKNLGISRQKIQKKSQYNYLNQDQFRQQSKNISQRKNVGNQLQKETSVLNDKNQRLAQKKQSKEHNLEGKQAKVANKHELQQIKQLQSMNKTIKDFSDSLIKQNQTLKFSISSSNKKLKILQTKIQDYQMQKDKNLTNSTKQLEDIQQLNKKIDQQKSMIKRLQKQHIEIIGQNNMLKQAIEKYKQEIAQNNKCLREQKIERKRKIQSINKLSQQKDILVKEKGALLVRYNQILKQMKKMKLQQQQQIKNKQQIKNVKKIYEEQKNKIKYLYLVQKQKVNGLIKESKQIQDKLKIKEINTLKLLKDKQEKIQQINIIKEQNKTINQQSKVIRIGRTRLKSQIRSSKEIMQHHNKTKIEIPNVQQYQQTGIFNRLKEWLTNIPNEISKLVESWKQKPTDLLINIKKILNKRFDLVNEYQRNAQNSLRQIQQQIKTKQQQRRKYILQNKGKSLQQIEKLLREDNTKLKSKIEGLNIKINLLESRQETNRGKQNLKRQLEQNLFRQKQLLTKKEQLIKLNNDKIIQLSKQLAQRQGIIQRLVKTNQNDKNIIMKMQKEEKEKMEIIQGMSKFIEEKTQIYEKLQRQFIQTNIFVRDTLHNFEQAIKYMRNQTVQNRQERDKHLKRNKMAQILRDINNNSDNYKMIINLNLKLDQIIQIFQKKVQEQLRLKDELNKIVKKSQFSNKTENKQREYPSVIQLLKLINQLQQSNNNLQQSLINCEDRHLIHKQFNDNNYRRYALFQAQHLFHSNIYQRIKNYRQLINNQRLVQQDKQVCQFYPQNSPRLTRLKYCIQSYLTKKIPLLHQFADELRPDQDRLSSQGDSEDKGKIQDYFYDTMLNQ